MQQEYIITRIDQGNKTIWLYPRNYNTNERKQNNTPIVWKDPVFIESYKNWDFSMYIGERVLYDPDTNSPIKPVIQKGIGYGADKNSQYDKMFVTGADIIMATPITGTFVKRLIAVGPKFGELFFDLQYNNQFYYTQLFHYLLVEKCNDDTYKIAENLSIAEKRLDALMQHIR